MSTSEQAAIVACREYEHWASEVRRLTDEIAATECPREREHREECERLERDGKGAWGLATDGVVSHFKEACMEPLECWDDPHTGEPVESGRRTLEEISIQPEVAGCRACSQLVELIRARRYARKRYGVAKRAVRRIGKLALTKEASHAR